MDENLNLSSDYLAQESRIYRKQEILFVLIDIIFTFHLIMLIAFLHYNHIDPSIEQIVKFYYPLLWILLSIIYDLFGLIITYLCYQTGLRMFTWIGCVFIILNSSIFVFILLLPLHRTIHNSNDINYTYSSRYIVFIVIWISISTLLVICVHLAFKLCKLIANLQQKEELSIIQEM